MGDVNALLEQLPSDLWPGSERLKVVQARRTFFNFFSRFGRLSCFAAQPLPWA